MKFSIITVCKNSENSIENTLLSVINQTYKNYEHIIVDGVSTDNTLSIIEKYRDNISMVISEPDDGLYDAMNKGINLSSGDYLFFLNSDDQYFSIDVLEKVVEQVQNADYDLIYGDIAVSDNETCKVSIQKHNKFNKIYLMKNTPCQPGTFYKKEVFNNYGNFDINFKIVSDHEWFLRVLLNNKLNIKYLGFPITIFNIGGLSTNKNREEKLIYERNLMLDKYFSKFERNSFEFISKYCRSLTTVPVISDILNLIFRFKI